MGRSKQAQLLQCFCYDTVTELDKKQGRTHSEWAALPCGHIFHVHCITRWKKESKASEGSKSSGPLTCPNKCHPVELYSNVQTADHKADGSMKKKKLRQPHPFTRLFFHDELHSDGLDSSSQQEITAFGEKAFGIPRDRKRPRIDDSPLGDDGPEDTDSDENDCDEAEANAQTSDEVQRLRRELREAQNTARQGAGARHEVEALRTRCEQLQKELDAAKDTIEGLNEGIDSLGHQMHERDFQSGLFDARNQIVALEKQVRTLETAATGYEGTIAALTDERDALKSDLHERGIKQREAIQRLEDKLRQAGTNGEKTIAELKKELSDKDTILLKVQAAQDGITYQADQRIKKAEEAARRQIEQAREEVQGALTAKRIALEDAQKCRAAEDRMRAAIESWKAEHLKLKAKYRKLKQRHRTVSDDEEDDERCTPSTSVASAISPVAPSRERARQPLHTHAKTQDSGEDDDGLPAFKIRVNAKAAGSALSSANKASPASDRAALETIELSSEDDGIAPVPTASSSRSVRSAPSQPAPGQARNLPPPPVKISSGGFFARKSELTEQRSDRHLPDFATGRSTVRDAVPKAKIKITKR